MWDYINPPTIERDPCLGEQLVERCVTAKMREYDGTVFLYCTPEDKERIDAFIRSKPIDTASKHCSRIS